MGLQRDLVHSICIRQSPWSKSELDVTWQVILFLFVMHTSYWSELVCASLNWPQPTKVDADVIHQVFPLKWKVQLSRCSPLKVVCKQYIILNHMFHQFRSNLKPITVISQMAFQQICGPLNCNSVNFGKENHNFHVYYWITIRQIYANLLNGNLMVNIYQIAIR